MKTWGEGMKLDEAWRRADFVAGEVAGENKAPTLDVRSFNHKWE